MVLVNTKWSVPRAHANGPQSDLQLGVIRLELGSFPARGVLTLTHPSASQSTDRPGIGMHTQGISIGICFLFGIPATSVTSSGNPKVRQKYSTIMKIVSRAGFASSSTPRENNNKARKTLKVVETNDAHDANIFPIITLPSQKTTELLLSELKSFWFCYNFTILCTQKSIENEKYHILHSLYMVFFRYYCLVWFARAMLA